MRTAASEASVRDFARLLSSDERARAERFHFAHLRNAYVVRRSALRLLLGSYLDVSPHSISFEYGAQGKPGVFGPANLHFNTSHSDDTAVFAFAIGCPMGVDVERLRPISEFETIAERFFCPDEAAEIRSMPAGDQALGLFLCWTRKEAFVKAIGTGLSCPLDSFRVTVRPDEFPRFLHIPADMGAASSWSLHCLESMPEHVAALAYQDAPRKLITRKVDDSTQLFSWEKFLSIPASAANDKHTEVDEATGYADR